MNACIYAILKTRTKIKNSEKEITFDRFFSM